MSNESIEEKYKKLQASFYGLKEKYNIEIALKQSIEEENIKLKEKVKKLMQEIAQLKGVEFMTESTILRKKTEKMLKLEEEKAGKEIEFISLKQKIDSIEKSVNEQEKIFQNIQTLRNHIQDIRLKLEEQKPVEVNYYTKYNNLEPTLNNFVTVEKNITDVNNIFTSINQEIKKNIENYQRKIVSSLQKIDEEENIDITFIENNLKDTVTYLKKLDEEIKKFYKLTKDITSKNIESNSLLTIINNKLGEFLEQLNKQKEEDLKKTKKKIPNIMYSKILMDTIKFPMNPFQSIALIPENIDLNNFYEPQLLRKDWTEIVTLTDDGGKEVDINFTVMAVGLKENSYFPSFSHGLSLMAKNTLMTTEINGKKVNTKFTGSLITFDCNLKNGESAKIHIKYKSIRNDINKYYNTHFVGLDDSMSGRSVKYTLLVPEIFVVVSFEKDIFTDRGNGKYSWQGVVPNEGIETQVKVSPKTAKWNVVLTEGLISNGIFNNTKYTTNKCFYTGNNKVIKFEVKSPMSNKIDGENIIDKGDKFDIILKNVKTGDGFFQQNVEFENRSKGSWECNIEPTIPEDEIKEKIKLKTLAEKIIKDNKNNKLLPHVKIGKWVHKNITYKLSFSGKKMTAIEILECKTGVCEHFTILYNALLNSINIPAIYCGGNAVNEIKSNDDDGAHAWSLVKIDNKWFPMDATWDIFSGHIPISHLHAYYGKGGHNCVGSDSVSFAPSKFNWKCNKIN